MLLLLRLSKGHLVYYLLAKVGIIFITVAKNSDKYLQQVYGIYVQVVTACKIKGKISSSLSCLSQRFQRKF